ncbi:DUF7710 domain-containing protein [Actinoplanes philippinensis]|uniref:DUF7710 domain-containing protein n=1 Tax=Actinoplanes philippinensis TaxID=35752 RepID=UPI00340738DC
MSIDGESALADVRRHHREQLNQVIRRPGMFGRDETAEQLVLGAMAAADGSTARWDAEFDGLRARGAFTATGVRGACATVLPAGALRDATASVYAGVAHRCGWLDLDRALSGAEYRRLAGDIGGWVTQDRTFSEFVAEYGTPSLWVGGSSPFCAKTLCYATADPTDELIAVHLWNAFVDVNSPEGLHGVHPEPVVLAVRHRPGDFAGAFSFTPEGTRRRHSADRRTVWVFHGDTARFAAGVFETREAGLAWAAGRGVTGVLTEFGYGGAYDLAVGDGRFTPSEPHHGTASHVAGFSPGLDHVHLTGGRPD